MEEDRKDSTYIQFVENQQQADIEMLLKTDAEIARRIAEHQLLRCVNKEVVKKAPAKVAKQANDEIAKSAVKEVAKTTLKKASQEAGKTVVREAAKKTAKAAANDVAKDTASFLFATAGTTAGTVGGATVGAVGGLPGIAVGMAAGHIVGKSSEIGINTVSQGFSRTRKVKQAMIDAFQNGKNPKTLSHMIRLAGSEIVAGLRNLGLLQSVLFPGLKPVIWMFVSILVVCLFACFSVISSFFFLSVSCSVIMESMQDSLGQLAGGQEVVYYCQYEDPWATYPYGDSTLSVCGCGPTTMAIIVSTLTGENVTPIDTADAAMEQGYYFRNVGTMWSYFNQGAESYNLISVNHGKDLMKALECIPQGGMVVVSVGRSDGTGNDLYRGNGHFIAIRGITDEGKVLVADPASRENSEKEWDYFTIDEIMKNCWSITYKMPVETESLEKKIVHDEQN